MRAALMAHGVLPPRAEQTAQFERRVAALMRALPASHDRAHIRAFSIWQVQHTLARRERHGQITRKSAATSLRLARAAVEISMWTTANGMTLAELRQEELDRWLQEGSSATNAIRQFLSWAARGRLMAPLIGQRMPPRRHVEPLAGRERLRVVRCLLTGDALDLRDRVAGCLILIYGQPLTRILSLTQDDVTAAGGRIAAHLGAEPLHVPEPLAHLTDQLASNPPAPVSTAVAGVTAGWLFPGTRVGQPLNYTHLQRRLKRLGVQPLGGRTGAVITLAAALPPTILAELLGISETSASKWYQLAAGEWGQYAAEQRARYEGPSARATRVPGD